MLQYTCIIEKRSTTRGLRERFLLGRLAAGGRYYTVVGELKSQEALEKIVATLNGKEPQQ